MSYLEELLPEFRKGVKIRRAGRAFERQVTRVHCRAYPASCGNPPQNRGRIRLGRTKP